nr:hypothetical protein [Tanacetum cinerariifolium]
MLGRVAHNRFICLANRKDTIQLENAVSTISHEYLLEFTSECGIPESLHPEFPGPKDPIVEFPEGKFGVYTKFFKFANFHWRTSAPEDHMPPVDSYSMANVTSLNTHRTPIQKQPEALLCLVGLSRRYFLGDDTRLRAAHEVPLLTATANRVIDMEDMTGASGSSGTPSIVEKSPIDFSNKDPPPLITESIRAKEQGQDELSQGAVPVGNPPYTRVDSESDMEKETVNTGALVSKRRRKKGSDEAKANAPRKVLRKDYVASHPSQSTLRGKSLASIGIGTCTTVSAPATQEIPVHTEGVSDPDPSSYAKPRPSPEQDVAQSSRKAVVTEDPDSENLPPLPLWLDPQEEVSTLQAQITGEERIKAAFEEFKKSKDDRASSRCVKMEARLDALSIDFDEELYPHMPSYADDVVSAGIAKGMSEGLKHGVEHGKAKLKISIYPEVCNPKDPWSFKDEILLEDAIAANVSRTEKKKKCRVVCRTHGVGSAHHARSDGVPVLVPTVSPQGLAILLVDVSTQTKIIEDEASPRLIRSKSLPPLYDLDWP